MHDHSGPKHYGRAWYTGCRARANLGTFLFTLIPATGPRLSFLVGRFGMGPGLVPVLIDSDGRAWLPVLGSLLFTLIPGPGPVSLPGGPARMAFGPGAGPDSGSFLLSLHLGTFGG